MFTNVFIGLLLFVVFIVKFTSSPGLYSVLSDFMSISTFLVSSLKSISFLSVIFVVKIFSCADINNNFPLLSISWFPLFAILSDNVNLAVSPILKFVTSAFKKYLNIS